MLSGTQEKQIIHSRLPSPIRLKKSKDISINSRTGEEDEMIGGGKGIAGPLVTAFLGGLNELS
jgi:hypothetical protein